MRRVYGARRDALLHALGDQAPHVTVHGLAAGFHAVARLRASADEDAIVEHARQRSVGVYGIRSYRPSGRGGPAQLVLGFGNLSESTIVRGIAAVADLL